MLDNYSTASTSRVKSDKNVSQTTFEELRRTAQKKLSQKSYHSRANLNGVTVEFNGNSHHQYEFWKLNWWAAEKSGTDGRIYSAFGLEGLEPSAYYCPDLNEAVFFNTEYYGQCKSWALGIAAAALERDYNTHSIHGACVDLEGRGVIIVAPTGTGKTTQAFKLMELPGGRVVGDDWVYIDHNEAAKEGHLTGRQPEKSLYMRTETQKDKPWLRNIFDESKCENVVTKKKNCEFTDGNYGCKMTGKTCVFNEEYRWCYYAFGNSRALVRREDLLGADKIINEAKVRLLVLLRRDQTSPAEVNLEADDAIDVLKKGEYMVRPGAGPKEMWGKMGSEPWYNPYLLRVDHSRQEGFFRDMINKYHVKCLLLNTGVESIEATHRRILRSLEAS